MPILRITTRVSLQLDDCQKTQREGATDGHAPGPPTDNKQAVDCLHDQTVE